MKTAKTLRAQAETHLERAREIQKAAERRGRWSPDDQRYFDRHADKAERLLDEADELDGRNDRVIGPRSSRGFDTEEALEMDWQSDGEGRFEGKTKDGREIRSFGAEESYFRYRADRESWDESFWSEPENPFGKFLRAKAVGPSDDWERRAISSTAGSGDLIPAPIQARILDDLKARSVLGMAGARFIDMESASFTISRVDSPASHDWATEGSTVSGTTDPNFAAVSLSAKTLRAIHQANRELVQDSPDFAGALERELTSQMRAELERVAFNGSSGSGEPTGLYNSTGDGISKLNFGASTNGAAVSSSGAQYGEILRAREQLLNSNVPDDRQAWITSPRVDRQYGSLTDANHQPLQAPDALDSARRLVTTSVPSTFAPGSLTSQSAIFYGRYSDLVVGMRLDPQIEIFRAHDPEHFRLSFLSFLRADVAVQRPDSFAILDRIST